LKTYGKFRKLTQKTQEKGLRSVDKVLTVENLKNLGITGLLGFILYAGFAHLYVWNSDYLDMKNSYEKRLADVTSESAEWKKTALEGLKISRQISGSPLIAAAPVPTNPDDERTQKVRPNDVRAEFYAIQNLSNESHGN
jgi:hypothetical protein